MRIMLSASNILSKQGILIPFQKKPGFYTNAEDALFIEINGICYMLDSWVEGIQISNRYARFEHFYQVGAALGLLHTKLQDPSRPKQGELVERWAEMPELSQNNINTTEKKVCTLELEKLTDNLAELKKLPESHILGDPNFANFFFDSNEQLSAIFDWDQSRFGIRVEDFISPIIHTGRPDIKRNDNPKQILTGLRGVLSGYQSTAQPKLSNRELQLLPLIFTSYFLRLKLKYNEETSMRMIQVLNQVFTSNKWFEIVSTLMVTS